MKTLKFLFAGAVVLMAFAGCKKTEELVDPTPVYDDAYYASYASISSSDPDFTRNSTGGTIHFKVSGGEVKVFVSCGTEWTVQNDNPDVFNAYISDAYYLTVSAGQNLVEEELTGTITLTTAEMRIAFASITVTQNAYGAPEITVETNEWNAPAVGKLTTTITVESTDEWTVAGGDEWLTIEKSETSLNLTAEENEDTEERTAEIVLTCTDSYNSDSETITVTQDGLAYITLSEEGLEFDANGGEAVITVESNYEWEYTYKSDWFSIEKDEDNGSLKITCDASEVEEDREGVVTFTAGDGASNIIEMELSVAQGAYLMPKITVETEEWNAPAIGKLTTEIGVEASYEWEFECDADWLTVEKTEASLRLTAEENTETAERTAEVVLTCTDGTTPTSKTVTVTQDGKAYITVGEEETTVSSFGSSVSVNVESNFEWEYACVADWVTISTSAAYLKIAYATNDTGIDRECIVVVKTGDGFENVAESEFKLFQSSDNFDALILEYEITVNSAAGSAGIYLPLYYSVNVTIDWGDGKLSTSTSDTPYHSYTKSGTYTVTINGHAERLNSLYPSELQGERCLIAVKQWGKLGLTSLSQAFAGCRNLKSLPDETNDAFSDVTTFNSAFNTCVSLESIPESLFSNCPNVTSFANAFYGCSSLESIPENLFDNCPNVTSFSGVFRNCNMKSIPENLFANCPNVTSFEYAFYDWSLLESIPENLFDNCPNVTSFSGVFDGCAGLKSIPENLFANCPNVTSFSYTFYYCKTIESIPDKLFANCPNVTDFSYVFGACYLLTKIPEGIFDNCPAVTSFAGTFVDCTDLTSVPVTLFDNCKKISSVYRTFDSCENLTGESPYTIVDGEKVHLYERVNHTDIFVDLSTIASRCRRCFYKCHGLTDYNAISAAGWANATYNNY